LRSSIRWTALGPTFFKVYEQIRDRLRANAVPIQIPIGAEADFRGVVDLIKMRAHIYNDDLGIDIEETEIPAEVADLAETYRAKLLEAIAETDDALTEKYLEGEAFTEAEVAGAVRQGVIAGTMVPMLCGSAFKNKGVQLLLDAVVDYLPAPIDVPRFKGCCPMVARPNGRPVMRSRSQP
jgi:elongation factor G